MAGLFGKIQNNTLAPQVTFVCTGNICRSAYAAAALRHGLSTSNRYSITVDSAGVPGLLNQPMDQIARDRVCTIFGKDFSVHSSQKFDKTIIKQNSLILAMTRQHQKEILFQFPSAVKRTFLLSEFSYLMEIISPVEAKNWDSLIQFVSNNRTRIPLEFQFDIEDPFMKDSLIHVRVYQKIDLLLEPILNIFK